MRLAIACLLVACSTGVASADETIPAEGPRNAITVSLVAPIGRGVALGYERAFVGSRLGLTSHGGLRFADGGDYRTRGYALGLELRWYTIGRAAFRTLATRAMVGFFLYGRGAWTLTVLRESEARQLVGRGHRIGAQVGIGYRFILGPAIELTPTFGFEVRTDVVAGVSRGARPTGTFGLTMGVLFERGRP